MLRMESRASMLCRHSSLSPQQVGVGKMAQSEKVLAVKAADLSLIPGTHVLKGRMGSCKLSSDYHVCAQINKRINATGTVIIVIAGRSPLIWPLLFLSLQALHLPTS